MLYQFCNLFIGEFGVSHCGPVLGRAAPLGGGTTYTQEPLIKYHIDFFVFDIFIRFPSDSYTICRGTFILWRFKPLFFTSGFTNSLELLLALKHTGVDVIPGAVPPPVGFTSAPNVRSTTRRSLARN